MMYFSIYQAGDDNQWHWRLTRISGSLIAEGVEGYATHSEAVNAVNLIRNLTANTPLLDESTGDILHL